jgi:hypothetical protein
MLKLPIAMKLPAAFSIKVEFVFPLISMRLLAYTVRWFNVLLIFCF